MNHDKMRELLPLYALGILEQPEVAAVQEHLAVGCDECGEELRLFESAVAELGHSAQLVAPPESLRQKVLAHVLSSQPAPEPEPSRPAAASAQIWKSWREGAAGDMMLVRAGEGTWEETGVEGVSVKRLSLDLERQLVTMLVRMQPGSSYPRHRHSGAEECYVLQGDLRVGEITMYAGDFQRAEQQSVHVPQSTVDGCLLFITSALEDEILQ